MTRPARSGTFPTNQDLDPVRLRRAFGVFPTGVVALAAEVDHVLTGLAASSFGSVSLDPPLVSFSVARGSKTWPQLRRAQHVGVTILSSTHGGLARQLAGPPENRFDGVPVQVTPHGAVSVEGGIAFFDTTIYREVEAGDHVIVLLWLHAVAHAVEDEAEGPLVFHRSGFGRLIEVS